MSIESITRTAENTGSDEGEFVRVDPRQLVVGVNVRLDARLDRDFVDSIRERGVLQAITAYRADEQRLVVLYGQRRTLGAIEAGRDSVPVMVVARPAEADRLGDQVVENDHRAGLTDGERVAAFEQMAAFGVTAAQIAKRTGSKKADVTTALTVAANPLAKGAVQRYDFLDLHQAAVVGEFADDKEAVTQLIVAAKEGRGFDHLAQRLRDARAEEAKRVAVEAGATEAGLTVIADPGWSDPKIRALSQLKDSDGRHLDTDQHHDCPGHAFYAAKGWHTVEDDDCADLDNDDEDLDEDPDDDDLDQDDEEGTQDQRPRRREVCGWMLRAVCTDFPQYGHQLRYTHTDSSSQKKTTADMTDAEREAARAERRDVIQANKDWPSATTVRREWLRTFLTRKAAPKTAAEFIAGSLARNSHELTQALTDGHKLAHELFGLEKSTYGRRSTALADMVDKAALARAELIALALVLAAYEERLTDKSAWRGAGADTARYLRYLQNNGYELAAIELRACGEPQPEPETADDLG